MAKFTSMFILLMAGVCVATVEFKGQKVPMGCSETPSMSPSGLLSMVHTQRDEGSEYSLYDLHILLKGDNRHLVLESIYMYCDLNLQKLWTVKAQLFKYTKAFDDFIAFVPLFTASTGFDIHRGPEDKLDIRELNIRPGSIAVKAASSGLPLLVILKVTKALNEGAVRGLMPIPKDYKSTATEGYYAVVRKQATKENAIHVFDEFGAYVRTTSFGKIDFFRGIYPSIPRAKDGYHLGFFEFMEGITSVVHFRVTDTAFEFNYNYMILEELAGCPPPVCYKDRFTEIVEDSDGAKRLIVNFWHFRFDGAYLKVDYASAQKYKENVNVFWLRPGLFNSYLDADKKVYIILEEKVFILTSVQKISEEKKKSETHLKDIPSGDALFYWRNTSTLYHFNSISVGGIDMNTKQLLPKKSLEDFFGFNIYDNYKDRPPIVDVYLEKEVIYVFVYNWFVSFSASSFSETGHFFKPKEVIKRKCVSEFLGCPVVKPRAGVPDERGYFPCGQVNSHTWNLGSTTGTNTVSAASDSQSKDKSTGAALVIVAVLVVSFLMIIAILIGAIVFFKKRNKHLTDHGMSSSGYADGKSVARSEFSGGSSIDSRNSIFLPSRSRKGSVSGSDLVTDLSVNTVNSDTGLPDSSSRSIKHL